MPPAPTPVPTFGLTHLALGVPDPQRSFEFYAAVLGMVSVYSSPEFIQAQTPGARDVIVFERATKSVGTTGGIAHFGFRLKSSHDIDAAASSVRAAGGTIIEQGEFVAGEPYLFARDLDGYLFEVWYELPTPVDTV